MKFIKHLFKTSLIILIVISCTDNRDIDFIENIPIPSNISATYDITQDNTGLVTITPNADGANSFQVDYGDGSPVENVLPGESLQHVYAEGTYEVKITAYNLRDQSAEVTQQLVVSFQAPQNLVVVLENDAAISKQVNITANADFAAMYDFYSGETGATEVTANIGETINYQYQDAGTYSVRVVAKGGAIQTTEYTVDFEVTEILAPIASAATPPARNPNDVTSIYGDAYTNVAGTDTFPDWNQGSQGSSWGTFTLNGDDMLQYTNLSYQGIQLGAPQDVTSMEFIHLEVWTSGDVNRLETSLISVSNGEKPVWSDLTAGEWTSIDIPIADFTSQGLTVADIHQLKFVGDPWAAGTVFIDNIYFWKNPSVFNDLPVTFDDSNLTYTWTGFGDPGFGPIPTAIITNPDQSGINTTSNVLEIQKPAGSQVWAGASMPLDNPIDFATNGTTLTIKVWSPRAGVPFLFKTEDPSSPPDGNGNPTVFAEVIATTTKANEWEELSFDMTTYGGFSTTINYENAIIFPDFGNMGQGESFYFDDIEFASKKFPINFETSSLTYTWTGFGDPGFGPIPTAIITNPDQSGINTSGTVLEIQKPTNSQVWAGASMPLDAPVDFTYGTTVKIKVWSPRAGVPFLLKMEDLNSPPDGNGNPSVFVEVTGTTNTANGWEEVSFDLTSFGAFSTSIEYGNVIVFPDFGSLGQGETFYFDDFILTN